MVQFIPSQEASPVAKGLVGAAACGVVPILFAVLMTVIALVRGDGESVEEVFLGFALYAVFGSLIGLMMGFFVGLPVYLLLRRAEVLRLDVFTFLGAVSGFAVFYFWSGGEHLDDTWQESLQFVTCGALSSLAFWAASRRA